MELTGTTATTSSEQYTTTRDAFSDLGSQEFLQLLITQLTNQDPMEPTGNEELMNQLASIREIEMSTTLTESLAQLTGQQHFSAASSMIGRYVTSEAAEDGTTVSGLVAAVRFTSDGDAVLQLVDGQELPLESVATIDKASRAAEALIGQMVTGINQADPDQTETVQGLVTATRSDELGEVWLELDTGEALRFSDVLTVTSA